jgi:signal transduction histidine kinase
MLSINRSRLQSRRNLLLTGALLSIVFGSALGVWESFRARSAQRESAEHTLMDYAQFASYLYTTRAYSFARDRALYTAYRPIHPSDPWKRENLPPVTVLDAIPDTTERCRPNWPVYRFRVDIPSRAVTYAGPLPDAATQKIIRDSIPTLAAKPMLRAAGFGYMFHKTPEGKEAIAFGMAMDTAENLIAVYGYRSCYAVLDTMDFSVMHKVVKVLPPALTRGLPTDSLLTLTVRDGWGDTLYQAPRGGSSFRVWGKTPMLMLGDMSFEVSIKPSVARMLVIGGVPGNGVPASVFLLAASIIFAIAGFTLLRSEGRLVDSRETFLANVSHELRTPLQQILMFVQLLRLGRSRTEEERERSLEIIETETHRLIALSNAVLTAARPHPRKLVLETVDVAAVARNAAAFFTPVAHARKMNIELDLEPASARGDPAALRQILVNVLDNSAKYGPVGQTISIGVRNGSDKVRLWVDDHGPGIPASEREKVWTPFVRLSREVEETTGGAGIGLGIVRDLAREMDALAELGDADGGGTRFTLTMRRAGANGAS